MEKLRVAAATDDGKTFVDRHFGDAEFFHVYDVSPTGAEFILSMENRTEEEEGHADPKKAKGIVGILKKEGVEVGLTRAFGPNIKRIKSKIVCVLTSRQTVSEGLELIRENFDTVVAEWDKGEDRHFLNLKRE